MVYLHLFYKFNIGTLIKISKFLKQIKNDIELYQNLTPL